VRSSTACEGLKLGFARALTAGAVSAPCASVTPTTWRLSPLSAAASLRPPAFATATFAASSRPPRSQHARAASARVTRQLRLLRAHGVIKKIPKTLRYRLTHHGHVLAAAVFALREATLEKLVGTAAA